jgi:nucleoside-diphosphate-sugar epimerase
LRVAIAGGHGKIALHLTRLLRQRGDQVRSIIRNRDHAADIREAGGEPVVCDLEAVSEEEAAEAIVSANSVVFAAGAGPGSGPERKWTVDYGAAVKLIAACNANGIRRYVLVSSIGADPAREGDGTFDVYLRAKGQADVELQASGLDYTIVRPVALTDDSGTGLVHIAERVERGKIPREDVASVLAAVLHEPGTARLTFEVTSGKTPVEEAVRAIARSASVSPPPG